MQTASLVGLEVAGLRRMLRLSLDGLRKDTVLISHAGHEGGAGVTRLLLCRPLSASPTDSSSVGCFAEGTIR